MNGVKIGYVDEISLRPEEKIPIKVVLNIERAYPLRSGSVATLVSLDLIGTKGIRIEAPASSFPWGAKDLYADKDTILSAIEPDIVSDMQAHIMPVLERIGDLAVSLDQVVQKLDTFLVSETTNEILEYISDVSKELAAILKPGGSLNESFAHLESFTSMLEEQEDEMASLTGHLNSISAAVDSAGLDRLSKELLSVGEQFNKLLQQINSGEGSAGKLIYSDSLYANLETLITDLDSLIIDLNENPGEYVHFSLFGKSKSKD